MSAQRLVAGVDSSTQSCKVVIRDADTGALVRQGRAAHPDGTEVDPSAWEAALRSAVRQAGGLDDVAAMSIAGQQHGMVLLDEAREVLRPALLWNDVRSAGSAQDLVDELGATTWAEATGCVPVASFTVSKLRWTAQHEPEIAAKATSVVLPHDWLTMKLRAAGEPLTTDRGDASGTCYWSPFTNDYRRDLFTHAFGRELELPMVAAPTQEVGVVSDQWVTGSNRPLLAPGTGDNMGAALGLNASPGTVVVSLGTSGTAFAVSAKPTVDPSGGVAGFADARGAFLPLVCTLNAALVLSAMCSILGVDHDGLDQLALRAEPGAGGISLLPYLAGERTPNRPLATGQLSGLTLSNSTPENMARAAVEGMLCGMADAIEELVKCGVPIEQIILIGGASASKAVQVIAPTVFGRPVFIAEPGEYVADGAARLAARLLGAGDEWSPVAGSWSEGESAHQIREHYAGLRDVGRG